MFKCMVVGSRGFNNYQLMKDKLELLLSNQDEVEIVTGGARGADALAERYARENKYELNVFRALWDFYGNSAGYIRNEQMHKYLNGEGGCVAFWDGKSKGTAQNFELAKKYNTPLRIVRY